MNSPALSHKAELRRQQILEAAGHCFKKSGFHGASMSEIAKSFGMSAGHIYNYFDSKEAIIEAIVQQDMEHSLDKIANLHGKGDLLGAILATVDEGLQRRIQRSALDTEVLAEACRNPGVAKIIQEADQIIREKLQALLTEIVSAKTPRCPQSMGAKVAVLMALFDGMMIRGIRQPDLNQPELAKTLRCVIRDLLDN